MSKDPHAVEKVMLVAVSLVFGVAAGSEKFFDSFLWGVAVAVAYPIVGAVVVSACSALRQAAHFGEAEPWDTERRLILAIFWPATLCFSLCFYPWLLLVNLLF